ncbi:unnamed protein product [Aureobasidium vineae]|uniref:Uncharacterized protein n=1 Tax=Aureobasidium vineae TaxID=2773715 RepID=A0A9N8JZT6_9PEZI|nr:unnamed protein product [Aureobasidium vineae]
MAYHGSYYILWTQQTHLFNEIDLLRCHIANIERQLLRAQQTSDSQDTKRQDRRKAKWVANAQRKYLKDLERALHSLLNSLSACQSQIARVHIEASWQADQYGNAWATYHDSQYEDTTPTQETYQSQVRSSSPDSGFSEPALYAQPFDLDLTEVQSDHTFSHELQHPSPLTINTQVVHKTRTPIHTTSLSPSAEDFTPTPKASHKAISPLAPPFSPFVFAKANPPDPGLPINSKPLFTQPAWSSPLDWSEQVNEEMTPVLPKAEVEEQEAKKGFKRRYSVAAIELIETRLRHTRQVSDVARGLMVQG